MVKKIQIKQKHNNEKLNTPKLIDKLIINNIQNTASTKAQSSFKKMKIKSKYYFYLFYSRIF